MKLDTTKSGLYTLFKPYQGMLLEHIWGLNKYEKVGVNSNRAHKFIQTTTDKKSRASVIFFLNDLVEERVLGYDDRTGKGGHHRVYYPKMTPLDFAHHVEGLVERKLEELVDTCKGMS